MRLRLLLLTGLFAGFVVPIAATSSGPVAAVGMLSPGERRCFRVAGSPGDGALVNLTMVEATGPGFGQLVSSDVSNPPVGSNVNYAPGTVDPNVAIAPIGSDRRVCYVNADLASVHLIADHLGTIPAASFTPALSSGAPDRKVDTRIDGRKVAPNGRQCFGVAGEPGDAAIVNLTPVEANGPGFGQLVSSDVSDPAEASNVNYFADTVDPNVAVAPIGADGQVCYVNADLAAVHLVADHLGTIAGDVYLPATQDGAPSRRVDTRNESGTTAAVLDGLTIAAQNNSAPYDRDDWSVWIDADSDCQDTRAEVLIRDSSASVTFTAASSGCTVETGEWYDEWTDATFTQAPDVDIDHTVPLANAHRSGGWQWDDDRKSDFANDLANVDTLRPMDDGTNSSKSDSGPEEWKPPHQPSWCSYATDWATIKDRWDLTVTQAEYNALDGMLSTCGQSASIGGRKVRPGARLCFTTAGNAGDAALVNLTPVEADGPGFGLLISSDVANPPVGSNVNFFAGTVDPNVAVAPIGDDGQVCYANANLAGVHLVADHLGTISASAFTAATASGAPARKIDTRTETPPPPPPTTTQPPTTTTPPGTTTTTQPPSNCDAAYPTVCIPSPPPDLNCGDIPHRNFTVLEPDPHGFDGNNDGIGCEN